jgi:hypothetical protein
MRWSRTGIFDANVLRVLADLPHVVLVFAADVHGAARVTDRQALHMLDAERHAVGALLAWDDIETMLLQLGDALGSVLSATTGALGIESSDVARWLFKSWVWYSFSSRDEAAIVPSSP